MALTGLKFCYLQPNRVSFFTSAPAFQTASKQWVLTLAHQVAIAVKEGGIMGAIGGESISKDEKSALKRIEQLFEFKV